MHRFEALRLELQSCSLGFGFGLVSGFGWFRVVLEAQQLVTGLAPFGRECALCGNWVIKGFITGVRCSTDTIFA